MIKYEKIIITTAVETYKSEDAPGVSALDSIIPVLQSHLPDDDDVTIIGYDSEDYMLVKKTGEEKVDVHKD